MSDVMRTGPEGDTPINPYSLLEAVNNSSDTAHMGWLIFLGIMAYLTIAVAGVSHKDLLLETDVQLPILQVQIQQAQFFQFAPILLVLFHIGVVSQLVLLARKTIAFDQSVRLLETTDKRYHPLRLELHNFFFVQAVAGPHRSAVMSLFLHGMSWLTLVVLPVVLILFIQLKFLPYHDTDITWTHRIALLLDMAMLALIGVFLTRSETSFFQAFWRNGRQHPIAFLLTTTVLVLVALFSFFVATVPGEPLDRMVGRPLPNARADARSTQAAAGFSIPFLTSRADGALFGLFHRNLIVTDLDLVIDRNVTQGEPTLNLRGRDLRFARLDRTDIHQSDLTGANLDGASLVGADLRNVRLQCSDIGELILTDNREAARCASARGANFNRANLTEARMSGIDLRDAKLEEATLEAAEIGYALASGANFASAHLERADFTGGAQLQGANFLVAYLQGADLTGAQLQFADFSSASLQAAGLAHANLAGAVLRDADLEAADLYWARLHGADLIGTRLRAADLRGAAIWMTDPPGDAGLALADLTELAIKPLEASDVASLKQMIDKISSERLRTRLGERLAGVMDLASTRRWATSPEHQRWQALLAQSRPLLAEGYGRELTDVLVGLMCRPRAQAGALATGIARRAVGSQFRGSLPVVYDKMREEACAGGKTVPRRLAQQLSSTIDLAKGN